jgi:signal peptidase I
MTDTDDPAIDEAKKKNKSHQPRDPAREVVETIVFVVVLVLLLKLFVTEAFVIPTGSMAETLYGYQKMVTCPKCGHEFPVNSHDEVEGRQQDGKRMPLYGFCCPNCRYLGHIDECKPVPSNGSGDRVLVLKPLFNIREPRRGEVVVFKYPEKPQEKHTAQNYIKRAEGFGGETAAIHRGDLYVTTALSYDGDEELYPHPSDPLDLWKPRYMYSNRWNSNPKAIELFDRSRDAGFPPGKAGFGTEGFEIVRKGEDQLLADRRIVWDNDKQPEEFSGKMPSRWYASSADLPAWTTDRAELPKVFAHKADAAGLHWIHYRQLSMPWKTRPADQYDPTPPTDFADLAKQAPTFIDNFLGYNAGRDLDPTTGHVSGRDSSDAARWVGDLILEAKVEFSPGSEVVMELSKSVNRFQARFTDGKVTLSRIGPGADKFGKPERPCKVTGGSYTLRFANVDCRLWVWVDGKRIDFGSEGDYQPAEPGPNDGADSEGWTQANDIDAPASIGAQGKVQVQNIKLHRDIYYTRFTPDHSKADIYYVQKGHYLCLGDNSAQSSDSRAWGTVPERLMLGKAVFVFFPVSRVGFIK